MSYAIETQEARARLMHKQGHSHYRISQRLNVSLSQVRRWLDPKAAELHEDWCGGRHH